ncbi:diamine oxidase [Paragonimus westermani]|uniref:Amine oxidase n=1 Tax=Paragonimus westermani TaxID=34504 RepID=A0A5J4NQH7_9TREM|nr:diamine oxidase [Paragonimus westermani]
MFINYRLAGSTLVICITLAIAMNKTTWNPDTEPYLSSTEGSRSSDNDQPVESSSALFDELSTEEYVKVVHALRTHIPDLYAFEPELDHPESLVTNESHFSVYSRSRLSALSWTEQLRSNSLWSVTVQVPDKISRSKFFTALQQQQQPELLDRYARAIVFHAGSSPPEIREYIVGPLSETDCEVVPDRAIGYNKRPLGETEYGALLDFLTIQTARLDPLIQQAYKASFFKAVPSDKWRYDFNQTGSAETRCKHGSLNLPHPRGNPNCLIPTFASPLVTKADPNARRIWLRLVRQVAPFIQYPVDLQFEIDHTSLDPTKWKVVHIWFQGQTYKSVEQLLKLYESGSLRVTPSPFVDMYPGQLEPGPSQFEGADMPPMTTPSRHTIIQPVYQSNAAVSKSFSPNSFRSLWTKQRKLKRSTNVDPAYSKQAKTETTGSRLFKTNRIHLLPNRRVRYQHWDFHLTMHRDSGLRLYGVHFAGQSLLAEAGLDETVTAYWGSSPFMQTMTSLESMFGVGAMSSELSPGVDCPQESIFLSVPMVPNAEIGPQKLRNGICLFEWLVDPSGGPLRRHFEFPGTGSGTSGVTQSADHTNFASGLAARALVVRAVSSLFNYDYVFDILFHESGVIEFAVSPTGYVHVDPVTNRSELSLLPWTTEHAFGFLSDKVPIYFVLHQHFFHYKLDLDVLGTKNFIKVIEIHGQPDHLSSNCINVSPGETKGLECPAVWMSEFQPRNELEAQFVNKFERPKQYLICKSIGQGETKRNERCVRLDNRGMIKSLFSDEHTKSFAWSRHQLIVTRQHDTEPRASSVFNGVDIVDPVVDFTRFSQDNESIYNEDVVLWVTVGNVHLPRQEDLPNTVTTGGRLAFFIQPHNLFEHSPDAHSCDRVYTRRLEQWLTGFHDTSHCVLTSLSIM